MESGEPNEMRVALDESVIAIVSKKNASPLPFTTVIAFICHFHHCLYQPRYGYPRKVTCMDLQNIAMTLEVQRMLRGILRKFIGEWVL
ncbi:hypothetical protein E2542_SST09145 [Spatholobus suberectus]|nr:hypothetical protein E2542_SST09145 [Spatholobus suberectus]